jgi:Ser/Thr protein kinase RdoA (MazF antagonist)
MESLPIAKSLLSAAALAQRVTVEYSLSNVRCELLTVSLRDMYLVASDQGRWVLAIYRAGWRTPAQIEAEWRFAADLAARGAPAVTPVPTRGGAYHFPVPAPEGTRYAALMAYVPGQHLRRRASVTAVAAYGRAIATIHVLADQLSSTYDRPAVDPVAIVMRSAEAVIAAIPERPADAAYLQACAGVLLPRLRALRSEPPAYGLIHGDVIRANAQVGDDGSVTVLDFDLCGPGWRAYDIASYLHTIRSTPEETRFAAAFLSGYRGVGPISPVEEAQLPLFEAVRALFDLGVPALEIPLWGRANFERWLESSLTSLRRSMQPLR